MKFGCSPADSGAVSLLACVVSHTCGGRSAPWAKLEFRDFPGGIGNSRARISQGAAELVLSVEILPLQSKFRRLWLYELSGFKRLYPDEDSQTFLI